MNGASARRVEDNGVLMLFAIKDHKSSVELGYGIEPIISDGDAGDILRGIRPILRQGNYAGAFLAAAQEIGNDILRSPNKDARNADGSGADSAQDNDPRRIWIRFRSR